MKIVLIGKNGQVGSEILRQAKSRHTVFSYSHEELDILDQKRLRNTILRRSPDVIINTAAYHVVNECEAFPEKAFATNVAASKYLADVCREKKIKLVTFSTDKVFDGTKNRPYKEDDIPNPLQVYGLSKYMREKVTLLYNPNSIIIRTCGIFGGKAGSASKKGNFVLYILGQAKSKKVIEIASDQTASLANAEDLAMGVLQLLQKKRSSGIYHLINEGYGSWAEYASEIVRLARIDLKIIPVKRGDTFNSLRIPLFAPLANTRAKKEGVRLPRWEDGLRRYIAFLKSI